MSQQLKTIKGVGGVSIEFVEEIRQTATGFELHWLSIWRFTAVQLSALREEASRCRRM
ncbi:hypothetical protein NYP20_16375 [Pseudomonas sp. N3-W]|uniref:hypothetical protein n=1 Tax=Pseudomonas sp. N3-W TaxID=2975049 RepID=UPI00217E664C|nr:hypothetical protein [Pseudomonas sp. N3-W]UWF46926.1 hypothetical protein NYP20_16375 [Pseudomonas sp. N3-W]